MSGARKPRVSEIPDVLPMVQGRRYYPGLTDDQILSTAVSDFHAGSSPNADEAVSYTVIAGEHIPVRNHRIALGMDLIQSMIGEVIPIQDLKLAITPEETPSLRKHEHLRKAAPALVALAGLRRVNESRSGYRFDIYVPELLPEDQRERTDNYVISIIAKTSANMEAQRQTDRGKPAHATKSATSHKRKQKNVNKPLVDDDNLRIYMDGVGEFDLLTKEQERELGKKVQKGIQASEKLGAGRLDEAEKQRLLTEISEGKAAEKDFIEANLRLVIALAKRYQGRGLDLGDLIQEGNFGLMRAVVKFDYQKGFKFSTYATWWIRQAITRGIADKGRTIRIPVHAVDDLKIINRLISEIEATKRYTPTIKELSDVLEMEEDKIKELLGNSRPAISLDAKVGEDKDDVTLEYFVRVNESGFEEVERMLSIPNLSEFLEDLNFRERYVIEARMGFATGEQMKMKEIASALNLSDGRVKQIYELAMAKLRKRKDEISELIA